MTLLINIRKKRGGVNIKYYLIPLIIGGLFLGLSQANRKELRPTIHKANNIAKVTAPLRQGPNIQSSNTTRNFTMEKSLSRIKGYIKEIESQNISLKEKAVQLGGVLEAREKELVGLDKENSFLKEELDTANKAQYELKAQLDNSINGYKEKFSQKDDELSSLAAIKVGLQTQITELNNKFLELVNVNSYLEKQITQNQQDRSALSSELNSIKEELNRQVLINETLDRKVAELNSALANKEQERLSIVAKMTEVEEKKSALELEVEQLKLIRGGNEKNISELNTKISDLNISVESMRDKISEFSEVLTKKEIDLNAKAKEFLSLKELLDKANKEKEALSLVLNKKEESLTELNNALKVMRMQIAELKTELRLAREGQRKASQQLTRKVVAVHSSSQQIDRINSENKSMQDKMRDLYQEMELIRTEARARKAASELDKLEEVKE
ncbi:MAG: hypothetical protein WCL25_04105 [bacterium]